MPSRIDYLNNLVTEFVEEVEERKKQQDGRPVGADVLTVNDIDLRIRDNCAPHDTAAYEQTQVRPYRLILRRGEPFILTLILDRPYDSEKDTVILEFTFGYEPNLEQRTRKLLKVNPKDHQFADQWSARELEIEENRLTVEIMIGIGCPVGEWSLKIQTGKQKAGEMAETYPSYTYPHFIYILFNPWVKEDPVYLEDEKLRQEYVLRDNGAVWQGAKWNQTTAVPWDFGQFEDVSLYSALLALRMSRKKLEDIERADPVLVARALTDAISSLIVAGRWQDPYDDGTKPWEWTGSTEILEKFVRNPEEHVKYGQCWVFSGVLVTLCRTLGIPCRSVTNLSSAHDTDRTLTIDEKYLKLGSENFTKISEESIWNFHVWNEAWMRRPDLPPGYGGWQVIDATPQERSQGRYQCGPMSVVALKQGEVNLNYDGWFIYGEFNADVVSWYYTRDSSGPDGLRLINHQVDSHRVGSAIVTSHPSDPMKELNITDDYKYPEGTAEERDQIRHAVRHVVSADQKEILDLFKVSSSDGKGDVDFTFTDLDAVGLGEPVASVLTFRNEAKSEKRTVNVLMEMHVLSYDGVRRTKVASLQKQVVLAPNQQEQLLLQARDADYVQHIKEHSQIAVDVMAHVNETAQVFSQRDLFMIRKPDLVLKADSQAYVNTPLTITIYFTNPTNQVLTNCTLKLEGSGLNRSSEVKIPPRLAGRATMQLQYSIVPRRKGERSLLAVFNSDQVSNIRGTCAISVI